MSLPRVDVGYVLHKALRQDLEKLHLQTTELEDKQKKYQAKLDLIALHQQENQVLIQQANYSLKKLYDEREPEEGLGFFCRDLPNTRVKDVLASGEPVFAVEGPSDETELRYNGVACAQGISTYPRISAEEKVGDPICDRFFIQMFEDKRIIACIADGCNWGPHVRDAASAAVTAFTASLRKHLSDITTIKEAGPILLHALSKAHNAIITRKGVRIYGTTTLLGGYILPLDHNAKERKSKKKPVAEPKRPENLPEYGLVIVSVGDCKVFRWASNSHRFIDITKDNLRGASIDTADPGGRLGPFIDDTQPDLRNMRLFYSDCCHNDLILFLSDGVHCNLTPEFLGVGPGVLCDQFHQMTWDEAIQANKKLALELRETFMASKLEEIIFAGKASDPAFLHDTMLSVDITPLYVNETILKYCMDTTQQSRKFMEENPTLKQPTDYRRFPGKMDHATCVVVRVYAESSHSSKSSPSAPIPSSSNGNTSTTTSTSTSSSPISPVASPPLPDDTNTHSHRSHKSRRAADDGTNS